ncbi:MAG TPA: 5'/3'-nucleotidase SurE [Candidatus Kapabacteria bacterium]|nr:5'/3'-nucleotidase SurE [Candidatus Kapabacteria bacterium]
MNVLVTNDDGINARGIAALVAALKEVANVIVIAPLGEQSAVGHALTMTLPLRVTEFHKDNEFFGFAVDGTPADCVKLALRTFLKERGLPYPDLVVSGINHGRNTAVNIIYSGTVSAATEATVLDVPAVAISLASYRDGADFSGAADFIKQFAPYVATQGLPKGTLLNVNVPALAPDKIKGMVYTRQGNSYWDDDFERRLDPHERPYYWLRGTYHLVDTHEEADDIAIVAGKITITPLHYDLTNHEFLKEMRNDWKEKM